MQEQSWKKARLVFFSFQRGPLYQIRKVDARKDVPLFYLNDLMGKHVQGPFEKQELVKANPPTKDTTFRIRKIGKVIKKIKGIDCVFVDFLFYPRSFR